MHDRRLINFSLFYVMGIFAMTFTIASPILIEIGRIVSRDASDMGLLFTLFSTGFVCGSLLSGVLARYFSKSSVLNINLILQTIFLFTFSFSKNYIFALAVSFMIGMTGGSSETMASMLLVEFNKGKEGYYLNMSQMYFGVGAFVAPYISSTIVKLGANWEVAYYVVAFLAFTNFVTFSLSRLKCRSVTSPSAESELQAITKGHEIGTWTPKMTFLLSLFVLAIFAYTASEDGLNAWIPTFFRIERGLNHLESGQILSFFWLAIAGGRLIMGIISRKINLAKLSIWTSILGMISVLVGLLVQNKYINLIFFLLAGLFYSGIWPNIVAFASGYFDRNKNIAMSIVIASGGAGALFAPWIVGVIYKKSSLFAGLLVCVAFLFIETLLMFTLYLLTSKKSLKSVT